MIRLAGVARPKLMRNLDVAENFRIWRGCLDTWRTGGDYARLEARAYDLSRVFVKPF